MNPAFLDPSALAPFAEALEAVQRTHPLVDCITNIVTVGDVANGLLAIDARPVMASAPEEIEYIVAGANAMLCNLGATAGDQREAMLKGSAHAHALGKPVVIDPVGIGASPLRHQHMHALLDTAPIAAIRGNISEIKALAGLSTDAGGVDASSADLEDPHGFEAAIALAQALARRHQTVIGISGPRDIVSDGNRTFIVNGGNEMMTRVTGSGCTRRLSAGSTHCHHRRHRPHVYGWRPRPRNSRHPRHCQFPRSDVRRPLCHYPGRMCGTFQDSTIIRGGHTAP